MRPRIQSYFFHQLVVKRRMVVVQGADVDFVKKIVNPHTADKNKELNLSDVQSRVVEEEDVQESFSFNTAQKQQEHPQAHRPKPSIDDEDDEDEASEASFGKAAGGAWQRQDIDGGDEDDEEEYVSQPVVIEPPSKSTRTVMREVLTTGALGIEAGSKALNIGLKLDGWGNVVHDEARQGRYDDALNRIRCKYLSGANLPPEVELGALLISSGVNHHFRQGRRRLDIEMRREERARSAKYDDDDDDETDGSSISEEEGEEDEEVEEEDEEEESDEPVEQEQARADKLGRPVVMPNM